MKTEDTEALRW